MGHGWQPPCYPSAEWLGEAGEQVKEQILGLEDSGPFMLRVTLASHLLLTVQLHPNFCPAKWPR